MKIQTIIILFMSILLFQNCGRAIKMTLKRNTVESGAIPLDFGKNVKTLLIMVNSEGGSMHKSYKKTVQKYIDAGYTGDYKIVDFTQKYIYEDSLDQYRYYYYYDVEADMETTSYSRHFFVYDEQEKRKYESRVFSGSWRKLTTGYMMALDAERLKAQQ